MSGRKPRVDLAYNGLAVARFVGLRRLLNCWRLCDYVEEGLRVEYYPTRHGIVVTSITEEEG